MSWFWKAFVVMLLALPVGAYVTGSLAGSQADLPDRLTPVVVEDPQPSAPSTPDPTPGTSPRATPGGDGDDDRRGEGRRGDDGRGDDGDDDEVQVIRPEPDDVGDDDRDDGRDDDTDDDMDDD